MASYFEIENLDVKFKVFGGEKRALSIEQLAIEKGEAYGLVGESGSGKTVLAQTILRLIPSPPAMIAKGSHIYFDGVDLLSRSERQMQEGFRGKRIAMIFQDPMSTLNPVFTVGRQITDVIRHSHKLNYKEAEKGAIRMLEQVQLPDAKRLMQKYPHELSGGQRQRVIIATALSCGAEFLIADEPTRNLDVTIQAGILKIIHELRRDMGITVLFIANNLSLAAITCDRVGILQAGSIVEEGKPRQIISAPSQAYTQTLLKTLPDKQPVAPIADQPPILEVQALKKYYPLKTGLFGGKQVFVKAVDGVDLTMRAGETLGIVGESGCGKTTLINTLLNLEKPTEGKVLFQNVNFAQLEGKKMRTMRKNIQVVFQDPFWSLDPRMLTRDVVGEPLRVHEQLNATQYNERVESLLSLVGLPADASYRFPHEFSGGQRQRVAIARALALNANFIVLDEPTSSLDVVSQTQILELLQTLKERYGLSYILISHDLSVVNYMSTTIMVMYLGRVVEQGDASLIFSRPLHPYTQALLGAVPRLSMNSLDELAVIEGNVPSAIDLPGGCRFHTRCTRCQEICKSVDPPLARLRDGRVAACHFIEE